MKKLILAGVIALGFMSASAQKVGYINSDAVMAVMPETQKAQKELEDLREALITQGTDLEKEANEKSQQFILDSAKLSPSMKEVRRNEIIKLYSRVQNYQQEASDNLKKAQQDKFTPIQQKALEAIKTVAKKNGYAYVLDQTVVFVGPDGDNLLPLVKKELNIVDAPAPKPAAGK